MPVYMYTCVTLHTILQNVLDDTFTYHYCTAKYNHILTGVQ